MKKCNCFCFCNGHLQTAALASCEHCYEKNFKGMDLGKGESKTTTIVYKIDEPLKPILQAEASIEHVDDVKAQIAKKVLDDYWEGVKKQKTFGHIEQKVRQLLKAQQIVDAEKYRKFCLCDLPRNNEAVFLCPVCKGLKRCLNREEEKIIVNDVSDEFKKPKPKKVLKKSSKEAREFLKDWEKYSDCFGDFQMFNNTHGYVRDLILAVRIVQQDNDEKIIANWQKLWDTNGYPFNYVSQSIQHELLELIKEKILTQSNHPIS